MSTPTHPNSADGLDPMVAFAELSRIVLGEQPLPDVLQRVAELAKRVIPGVDETSITLMQNNRPYTMVFTGPLAAEFDERQYEAGYGPCLDAAVSGDTIAVDHSSADTHYPGFSEMAVRAGVLHTVSVGLPVAQRVIGGINIYGSADLPFDASATDLAETFASYAAVAVANAHLYSSTADLAANMRRAMESRAVIEQAKGIIMGRDRCNSDEAFDQLTRISQQTNTKLRDVADAVVADTQP